MIYRPSQREQAITFIDKMFERKKWVKIEHIPEKKTLNQNSYLWLIFTIIAEDTGNTKEDIYEYYLEKFPTYKEIDIHGDQKRIKITLSQFTVEQATVFIDRVVIDGRQEGFVLPDPQDLEALNQYQYYRIKGIL
jgi:hypothetical protein